jgi:hypothetical protein
MDDWTFCDVPTIARLRGLSSFAAQRDSRDEPARLYALLWKSA